MSITLYIIGVIVTVVLAGVVYEMDSKQDEGFFIGGAAIALFWPVVLSIALVVGSFVLPFLLGQYLYRYAMRKTE